MPKPPFFLNRQIRRELGLNRIRVVDPEVKDETDVHFDAGTFDKTQRIGTGTAAYVRPLSFDDDFSVESADGDTDRWNPSKSAHGTIDINHSVAGKLYLAIAGAAGLEVNMEVLSQNIVGDFTIILEWDSFSCEAKTAGYFMMRYHISGDDRAAMRRYRDANYQRIYFAGKIGGVYFAYNIKTSVTSGKFKLVRSGSTMQGWYDIGAGWVKLGEKTNFSTATGQLWVGLVTETDHPDISVNVDNFSITSTRYFASGTFISRVLDAGSANVLWDQIKWTETQPAGCELKLQYRAKETSPPTDPFEGPTGTGDYFTNPAGTDIPTKWDGKRYCQYKGFFTIDAPYYDELKMHDQTDTYVLLTVKTLTETLSLSDKVIKEPRKTLTETLTLTDVYSRVWTIYRVHSETLTLTDVVATVRLLVKVLTETLTLTDTVSKQPSKVLAETLTLSDVYSRVWTAHKALSETLSLTDTISKKPAKSLSEVLTLVDTFSRTWATHKVLVETLTLTDAVAKQPMKMLIETLTLRDRLRWKVNPSVLADLIRKYIRIVDVEN